MVEAFFIHILTFLKSLRLSVVKVAKTRQKWLFFVIDGSHKRDESDAAVIAVIDAPF